MAVTIGVDAFSMPDDVSRLTGQAYSANSSPNTLAQAEDALRDAFAIIEAKLVAVGIGAAPAGGYTDPQLLKLMAPISDRLAASSLLMGQGDIERGTAYYEQAQNLLDQISDGLDTTLGDESERGRSYAAFGGGALGAQEGLPITTDDIYETVKRILHPSTNIVPEHNDVAERIMFALQGLAQVATTGRYADLSGRPVISVNFTMSLARGANRIYVKVAAADGTLADPSTVDADNNDGFIDLSFAGGRF